MEFAPLHAVDFFDAKTGWAVGEAGTIIRTADGGATWQAPTTMPAVTGALNAVSFPDAADGWAVGDDAVILHTTDGGATWSSQATGLASTITFRGVSFADAQHGWAVGQDASDDTPVILATSNGGATWTAESMPTLTPAGTMLSELDGVRFIDKDTGWAIGASARAP